MCCAVSMLCCAESVCVDEQRQGGAIRRAVAMRCRAVSVLCRAVSLWSHIHAAYQLLNGNEQRIWAVPWSCCVVLWHAVLCHVMMCCG